MVVMLYLTMSLPPSRGKMLCFLYFFFNPGKTANLYVMLYKSSDGETQRSILLTLINFNPSMDK